MGRSRFGKHMLPDINRMAEEGLADWQIAHNLSVDKSTFTYWKQIHPEIKLILEQARQPIVDEVEDALLRRALGEEYTETHTESVGRSGKKKRIQRIKKIRKRVLPDVKAIQFYLTNRAPERWKFSQKVGLDTNVMADLKNMDLSKLSDDQLGAVEEALEHATNSEPSED